MSKIEWTGKTWNPIVGCSVATPGCTNCYAMSMAHRLASNPATPQYHGTTQMSRGGPVFTGKIALAETILTKPLRTKKPTTWFVNSMGDLFHENAPCDWIDQVFAVMALCPQHTFQVLTKRAARMRDYFAGHDLLERIGHAAHKIDWRATQRELLIQGSDEDIAPSPPIWPLPNVWLGVSAEDQRRANERIPHLLQTPAVCRFTSAEPLLGPVDLTQVIYDDVIAINAMTGEAGVPVAHKPVGAKVDWVIVGGESGHKARPMHPDWARKVAADCLHHDTPFFFKQWGEWGPDTGPAPDGKDPIMLGKARCAAWDGGKWETYPNGYAADPAVRSEWVYRLGKKATGRLLDGREWNETPTI